MAHGRLARHGRLGHDARLRVAGPLLGPGLAGPADGVEDELLALLGAGQPLDAHHQLELVLLDALAVHLVHRPVGAVLDRLPDGVQLDELHHHHLHQRVRVPGLPGDEGVVEGGVRLREGAQEPRRRRAVVRGGQVGEDVLERDQQVAGLADEIL
ncbi:hypothetical protein VTK73DRAFT_6131 [Phialemonium thermophilum]|uniref:Uncharacterized protein n=1 Tax=Phialemonium thermophilum TaxID=223376 RepID=A0ABR3UZZ9_9PEZI